MPILVLDLKWLTLKIVSCQDREVNNTIYLTSVEPHHSLTSRVEPGWWSVALWWCRQHGTAAPAWSCVEWHAEFVLACLSLTGRCCQRTIAWTSRQSNAWAPSSPLPSTWSPSSTLPWVEFARRITSSTCTFGSGIAHRACALSNDSEQVTAGEKKITFICNSPPTQCPPFPS